MANDSASITQEPQLLQLAELFNYVEEVRVWVKDRDGRFRWVNRTVDLMYSTDGHKHGSNENSPNVLGKTDYDLSPRFMADQYLLDDEYVLAGNRIVNRIELLLQPDGTNAWHITNKIPLFASDGTIVGTAGVSQRLNNSGPDVVHGTELGPVLAYMRDHYETSITNEQLARSAHMSVRAFERKFQSCFHTTPQTYLRKLRMRMASHALVYTKQLLAQVASSCGFADQSHFTREFRRHFGRTPRQYREHYSQAAADAVPGTNPAAGEQYRSKIRR